MVNTPIYCVYSIMVNSHLKAIISF